MVLVKFFNLIRSNHNVEQLLVEPGTVQQIIIQIRELHPQITQKEFHDAVLFVNNEKVMHLNRFNVQIKDHDELIFTNFVGGG